MMVKLNSITQWLRRGLPFIAVLLLVSCSSNTGERKILPADEMAHVLYDYQLATSLAQEDNQGMSSSDEMINSSSDSSLAESHRNYLKYRTAVFSKYNISESDYKHSLAFYLRNPEEMKRLNTQLERVIAEVNRNNSEGRGGAIPSLGEIRNCHINIGTGKELTIKDLSALVAKTANFTGEIVWDETKPDGTPRKLINVDKLHSLGWKHKVEIEEGVEKLYKWYQHSLEN